MPTLIYKAGEAFLEMQCKYGNTDIVPGQGVVAYIVDAAKEFGAPNSVKRHPDGRQSAMLKVASPDGGFYVVSYTGTNRGEPLQAGDYVIWIPARYEMPPDVEAEGMDFRFGWVGFIVAKVKPELKPDGTLTILSRYD